MTNSKSGTSREPGTLNRESFTAAVLRLLEEGLPPRSLNLRGVAKEVGCAHTNAYNYFSSYDELLWWSVKAALEELLKSGGTGDRDLIEVYTDFGITHPAWYRLIWLDPLRGDPPEEVTRFLSVPAQAFIGWIGENLGRSHRDAEIQRKTTILHSYLHGELAAYVTGRAPISAEELRRRTAGGSRELWKTLFQKDYPRGA